MSRAVYTLKKIMHTSLNFLHNLKKGKRSPSHFLFSVLAFLSLKRCNLATFKLQQTLSLNAKKFTKQKKGKRKPAVASIQILPCSI